METGEKTVIENFKNDIDKLPDSDFSKSDVRLFDEINNRNDVVLP